MTEGALRAADLPADRVRGPVLRPGDSAYDAECAGFQSGLRHRPDVVVRAAGPEDVRTAVRHAAAGELPFAVQATGHGLAVPLDGGLLLSTRGMADVRVDAAARTAQVSAGASWGRVVTEAARYGLAPPSGSGPGVGAVSYTLNGGVGLLARQTGYAADLVRSFEVVTADGRLRRVAHDSEPDLFWALRGGGGGFGVVTSMEIGLMPLERFYGGQLVFPGELAGDVVEAWGAWTKTVPERLTSSVTVLGYPDLPLLPEHLRGRHVVQVQIAFDGPETGGERLVEPLRSAGPRLAESLRMLSYAESAEVYREPDRPRPYEGDNALLGSLPDRPAMRTALRLTEPTGAGMTVVGVRHLGGATARQPEVPNAVGHRDAEYLLGVLSVTEDAGADSLRAAHEQVFTAVEPWTVGSSANFRFGRSAGEQPEGARSVHEPEDRRRLAALRMLLDPAHLFGR